MPYTCTTPVEIAWLYTGNGGCNLKSKRLHVYRWGQNRACTIFITDDVTLLGPNLTFRLHGEVTKVAVRKTPPDINCKLNKFDLESLRNSHRTRRYHFYSHI